MKIQSGLIFAFLATSAVAKVYDEQEYDGLEIPSDWQLLLRQFEPPKEIQHRAEKPLEKAKRVFSY